MTFQTDSYTKKIKELCEKALVGYWKKRLGDVPCLIKKYDIVLLYWTEEGFQLNEVGLKFYLDILFLVLASCVLNNIDVKVIASFPLVKGFD